MQWLQLCIEFAHLVLDFLNYRNRKFEQKNNDRRLNSAKLTLTVVIVVKHNDK